MIFPFIAIKKFIYNNDHQIYIHDKCFLLTLMLKEIDEAIILKSF